MARNWALVVGINNYNPLNFTPLKYAKRDAERISEFFKAAGFEVCCFTDDSPPLTLPSGHTIPTQPTYGNLITFLQDRFETEFLTTGDNCWFFFAGHGERHQDRDYLMPIDANSRGAEVIAGLTINYVQERLSRCGADNVIMVLDACRSEGSRDGGGIRAATQKGLITISSCQPTQKSWELDELQQGAFTYALLEALQLPGAQSCATVERLSAHLKQRIPALCQQYGIPANKIPTPRISADPIEKQHFILIPQYARQADLDRLKLDAFRLRRNNPTLAEQICIRLNALAMGRDLEVLDLLFEIRNEVRSRFMSSESNISDAAVSRSHTAATTTISDQPKKDGEPELLRQEESAARQNVIFDAALPRSHTETTETIREQLKKDEEPELLRQEEAVIKKPVLSEQNQRILGYFIEEAKDHLNTIEHGILTLQETIQDKDIVNGVFQAAHWIKGGAAMLNLGSIQRTSRHLEGYFKALREAPTTQVDRELESMLLRVFDILQTLLEELQGPFGLTDDKAQEVMTDIEPVFNQLEIHLNELVAQAPTV